MKKIHRKKGKGFTMNKIHRKKDPKKVLELTNPDKRSKKGFRIKESGQVNP